MNSNLTPWRGKAAMLAAAGLVFGLASAIAAPPETISGTYGTVVIGDLPGTIDRGAELAKKVNPGVSGEALRAQLGMALGDEGLKSIPAGSGLVLTVPTAGRPFLLLETAKGKAESVVDLVKQRMPNAHIQAVNENLIAMATDEQSLTNATGAMGTSAAELLENNDDKFIVATFDSDTLFRDKGQQLQSLLDRFSQQASAKADAGSTGTANAVKFMGHFISAAGKRTDVVRLKIDISGDGVEFEKTLWPVGGVNLSEPEGPTGQELYRAIAPSDNAMFRYEYTLDTQSLYNAMKPMVAEAFTGAAISSSDQAEVTKIADLAGEGFGDGMAGWLGSSGDKIQGTYLISIADQDKALQYIEDAAASINDGSMKRMYSSMGMETSATFTRNARTINGEQAHTFSMSIEGAQAMMPQMQNIDQSIIMVVDGKMLFVFGDVPAEPAVAAARSGSGNSTPLQSRAQLPPNGVFYMDYDMGAVTSSLSNQDPKLAQFAEQMKGVTILEAAYVDDDNFHAGRPQPGDSAL